MNDEPSRGVRPRDRERARAWLGGGLLDLDFYAALRGRTFIDASEAALDWVTVGMPARLSPDPFLDFVSLSPDVRRLWRRGKVRSLLDHLCGGGDRARPIGPLAGIEDPATARAAMIEAATLLGRPKAVDVVDWDRVRSDLPSRVPGRVSVVVPTHADSWFTIRAVDAVLETAGHHTVEVVVVDNGCLPHIALALVAAFLPDPRVRVLRLSDNRNFAGGSNAGFAHSTGENILFLNNDTRVRGDWLQPLVDVLSEDAIAGAQPLLLFEDDTIQSAGTVFLPDQPLPCHLLVGHPPADGQRVKGRRFSAVTAAAMLIRASDIAELEGFDETFRNGFEDVDLCLRALALRPGGFRVVPEAVVTHHESVKSKRITPSLKGRREFIRRWGGQLPTTDGRVHREVGFVLGEIETDNAEIPSPRPRVVARHANCPGSLRWSLNLPSTPGFWGDTWGDTYFGEQLADALRSLGQDVVMRRRGAHAAGPTYLDDVALAIRGRVPSSPVPGRLNILWVISHPDEVTAEELDGFDLVFAASVPWSEAKTREWGRPVLPLLQATAVDPEAVSDVPLGDLPEAIFVGNTDNGRRRELVHQAVAAGLPLAVYGRGWEGLLPDGVWRGEHVPNDELPRLYRRHGVMLADHWPDMTKYGFVANRVFDALAAGARVLCDDVVGIEALLGDGVRVVRHPEDFLTLWEVRLPDARDAAHSFKSRACSLLTAVLPPAAPTPAPVGSQPRQPR